MANRTAMTALAAGIVALSCCGAWNAHAQEAGAPRNLRLGLVASSPAVAGVTEIERAYSHALGVPVTTFVARDYPTLIEAQVHSNIDYAIYSASAYAVAWKACQCIEPIAAPTGSNGTNGVKAVLIRRKGATPDGHPTTAASARIASHPGVLASSYLAAEARTPAATAGEAERQFIDGEREMLIGWVADRPVGGIDPGTGTLARLAGAGLDPGGFEIVWSSETLRFGPHAVREDLPDDLKSRIRDFLTNMRLAAPDIYDFIEAERQGGFVRVRHEDYLPAVAMVEKMLEERAMPPR